MSTTEAGLAALAELREDLDTGVWLAEPTQDLAGDECGPPGCR